MTQAQMLSSPRAQGASSSASIRASRRSSRLYDSGKLAVVANAGTLLAPIDQAQYKAGAGSRPPNLFSHSDQQNAWQGLLPGASVRTGWGGRFADRKLVAANAGSKIPDDGVGVGIADLHLGAADGAVRDPAERRRCRCPGRARMRCRRRATTR